MIYIYLFIYWSEHQTCSNTWNMFWGILEHPGGCASPRFIACASLKGLLVLIPIGPANIFTNVRIKI